MTSDNVTGVTPMKRLLFCFFVGVVLSQPSLGEIRHLEGEVIAGKNDMSMNIFCVDGYKFVLVHANPARHASPQQPNIVQMFEEKNGNSVPQKC